MLIPESQPGKLLGFFVLDTLLTEEADSNVLVPEWDFEIVVSIAEMGTVSETVSVFVDSSLGTGLSVKDEALSDDGSQALVSVDFWSSFIPVVVDSAASVSMGSSSSSIGSQTVLVLSSAEIVASPVLHGLIN